MFLCLARRLNTHNLTVPNWERVLTIIIRIFYSSVSHWPVMDFVEVVTSACVEKGIIFPTPRVSISRSAVSWSKKNTKNSCWWVRRIRKNFVDIIVLHNIIGRCFRVKPTRIPKTQIFNAKNARKAATIALISARASPPTTSSFESPYCCWRFLWSDFCR